MYLGTYKLKQLLMWPWKNYLFSSLMANYFTLTKINEKMSSQNSTIKIIIQQALSVHACFSVNKKEAQTTYLLEVWGEDKIKKTFSFIIVTGCQSEKNSSVQIHLHTCYLRSTHLQSSVWCLNLCISKFKYVWYLDWSPVFLWKYYLLITLLSNLLVIMIFLLRFI